MIRNAGNGAALNPASALVGYEVGEGHAQVTFHFVLALLNS